MQQIDLSDGREDGRIGPDLSGSAPPCPRCGKPLNPKREACLYCELPIDPELSQQPAPPRLVTCVKCGAQMVESDAYISPHGSICAKCHYTS